MDQNTILRFMERAVMAEQGSLTLETKLSEIEEWDSLSQSALLSYLGPEYKHLTINIFLDKATVQDVVNTII